jgi:hypothetical protein
LRRAPPAAEAALTLAAFTLAVERVLNLADASAGDLQNHRIAGDRTVGDHLCRELLASRNIPSTQGPLQSSSFRGGYLAEQVRNAGTRRHAAWQSDPRRSLPNVGEMARALADEFLDQASAMPSMPATATVKSGEACRSRPPRVRMSAWFVSRHRSDVSVVDEPQPLVYVTVALLRRLL